MVTRTRLVVGEKEVVGDRVGERRDLEKERKNLSFLFILPTPFNAFYYDVMMMNGVWYGSMMMLWTVHIRFSVLHCFLFYSVRFSRLVPAYVRPFICFCNFGVYVVSCDSVC